MNGERGSAASASARAHDAGDHARPLGDAAGDLGEALVG